MEGLVCGQADVDTAASGPGVEASSHERQENDAMADPSVRSEESVKDGAAVAKTRSSSIRQRVVRTVSSFFGKKQPATPVKVEEEEEEEEEPVPDAEPQTAQGSLLPPSRIPHSAVELVGRERDVRIELLQALVKEHAQLRRSLSLGLAGLHGMSVLVAQEEARQIWLKGAVVVEREAIAAIDVLRGLDVMIRERARYLDDLVQKSTNFLLRSQQIARRPGARAGIADHVQGLLPDAMSGRVELPDLHSMFMLLKAWEGNKVGFVISNDGASFENPTEMLQMSEKLLEKVLQARGESQERELVRMLQKSSDIVNNRKGRRVPTLEMLGEDIRLLDSTLDNLQEEQHHLEDHLDRAMESQVSLASLTQHHWFQNPTQHSRISVLGRRDIETSSCRRRKRTNFYNWN